nr:9276_t:CDS:2 [Entrophospora candida]
MNSIDQQQPPIILHYYKGSAFAQKIVWALTIKRLKWISKYFFQANFIISLIPEDPNAPAIFKSQELLNDRSLLMNQKIEPNKLKPLRPFIIDALKSNYEWIELQLSDDRQWFLDTSTPSIGDIHVAMNIWFLNVNKGATKEFGDITELYPKTHQWFDRFIKFIRENQQHKSLRISGEEALEIAKNFKPSSYYNKNSNKRLGNKKIGDKVSISPDDYGKVPVKGTILSIGDRNIAIRPIDVDKTGIDVVIWFPIAGYNPTLQKIKVGPKSCSFIIPADNNNNGRKNITLPKFLNRDRLTKSKKSSIDNTKNDTVATATCITDTEDTGSSWLKHSSINSIISRWSEDLDQCNQTFQRQLEESHQLDQKMIEFNTEAANIDVLVQKAKTIKYDICATLKEISSKQIAIDEFLSSMERVFEGICLEDVNSYDYQRETNYKNFESVNQKINDMNCNLLTMINDTNTDILPSCNSNNITDMMIDDPIDGLMDLFNSQLVSLEWIDSSAKHLSFLIQQAQDLLDNSQEDSLYNLTF